MDIWQHADGRQIIIEGTEDDGYAVAVLYRTKVRIKQLGKPVRTNISPFFVFSEGYGVQGRLRNERVRTMRSWTTGTRNDAIGAAYKYMKGRK
jgi:hypothetical protein